jgi:polyphenol oxidase
MQTIIEHISHSSWQLPLVFYQSQQFSAYAERLIHGFTGKPLTFGGSAVPRSEILLNRQHLCEALGLDSQRLIVPDQTHSANIKSTQDSDFSQTDAVILTQPGVPVLLMFADCTPLILYDPIQHIGAVIHAGWRGTAQSITAQTALSLIENYGCKADNLIAVIGPAIGGCCYEVSQEVLEAVQQTVSAESSAYAHTNKSGKPQINLQQVNALQLQELGLRPPEILEHCTQCETEKLWSYRRGEGGRQSALLCLQ